MSKKEIFEKLKASLLAVTAAVTGMTSSACNVKEGYTVDNVGFDPGVHDTIDSKPETDTVETSYDSSVTTGPSDSVDSTVYTTLENVDVPEDVVVTTVNESSIEEGSKEAVTTKINGTVPHGKTIQDGGSGVQRRTEAPKTQESQNKPSTKSTAKVTTAKPVTTKKVTTKTTPKTTVTSAKTTTTVTTTTTEIVTERPVTESEDYSYLYNKDLIGTNGRTFNTFADMLYHDIMANSQYNNSFFDIDVGYGPTSMSSEFAAIFWGLNKEYIIDAEVLGWAFGHCSSEEMANYYIFVPNVKKVLEYLNVDVDWTKYTLNPEIGNCLNEVKNAYNANNLEPMIERFVSGNVNQDVLNNSFAMGIIVGYLGDEVLNFDEIQYNLFCDIEYLSQVSNGYDYGNSKFY